MTQQEWVAPVDLDNCASEPIQVPGAIQPHGVLLAVSEPGLEVAIASANLPDWFGIDATAAIGRTLGDVIGSGAARAVASAAGLDWVQRYDELELVTPIGELLATLHRSGTYLVVELERFDPTAHHTGTMAREAAMALQSSRSVLEVADAAARWIRSLTGFDRVMVYRFDPEWNGEVIAEHKRDDLNTFLGLHYPSTDIPPQARELYRTNWLRLIPDIAYTSVALVPPAAHDSGAPLDLSTSTLRSVSPIHIEYLSNMGVGASMSVSIVINGELWGLIACHHYSGAHHVSVATRNAAEFLAQLISLRIAETVEADRAVRAAKLGAIADHVSHAFTEVDAGRIAAVLQEREGDVLALAGATGAYFVGEDLACRVGATPPDEVVVALASAWPPDETVFVCDELRLVCPAAEGHEDTAAGVLAVALSEDRREVAMWFRAERVRTVDWGGDPHNAKLYATEGDQVRLSPRKSFELWRETVRGRAEPWDDSEVRTAQRFTRQLNTALLRNQRDSAMLARDLQRAMRPATLPTLAGFEVSVFDQSAGRGEIGGDWHDVFTLASSTCAFVVGDVAGHGLRAASEMAQLRNVLRAYLVDRPDPADALERLSGFMLRTMPGSIATAVCATIDTATSEIAISHAGHVPALLVGAGGDARWAVRSGDLLLGFRPAARRIERLTLAAGESIVLYTDGLVETRGTRVDEGLERLRAAAQARPHASAAELAAAMVDSDHEDDVTVLVVRRR